MKTNRAVPLFFLVCTVACLLLLLTTPRIQAKANGSLTSGDGGPMVSCLAGSCPSSSQAFINLVDSTATPRPTVTLPPFADYFTRQQAFPSGTRLTLESLHMADGLVGWAVANGHILHTTDGGRTWRDSTPPDGVFDEGGFFALDGQRAWATKKVSLMAGIGEVEPIIRYGAVWNTYDGGMSWRASKPFYLPGIDYEEGAGGTGWFEGFHLAALRFVDSMHGWFVAAYQQSKHSGLSYALYRTQDGGYTWNAIHYPYVCYVRGMEFKDVNVGYLLSDCAETFVAMYLQVSITKDGGSTWTEMDYTASSGAVEWLAAHGGGLGGWMDRASGFIRGRDGFLAAGYTMSGNTASISGFVPLNDEMPAQPPWYSGMWIPSSSAGDDSDWISWSSKNSEEFYDASHGWRVFFGVNAWLQRTEDGGKTWISTMPVPWRNAFLEFSSVSNGWAVEQGGERENLFLMRPTGSRLFRTTDGGRTWETIIPVVQ